MIKFYFIILIYLIILLKVQCAGKLIHVEVKIKDDWEVKREFIYLKNVEINDRFVLKVIEKNNNRFDSFNKNIEGYLRSIDLNLDKNMFEVQIFDRSKYIPSDQLKRKILIEITINEIIQNFLPGCEKMVLRNNNFIENITGYETSILFKSGNNFSSAQENMENYKDKLLSSYWTEINLIGYKIELLEKQKVEYPKEELKSRIIDIGNKIRVTMEKKERDCFNCGVKQIKNKWHKYLKDQYLCHTCFAYCQNYGNHRHKSLFKKTKKIYEICFTIYPDTNPTHISLKLQEFENPYARLLKFSKRQKQCFRAFLIIASLQKLRCKKLLSIILNLL
uniref:Uncharacterized protein n=1 Tax=Meloidogyne enterolobii TaxID=390850 RepID=A0A6V7XM75_MELEN|nr:unnamed protein product [Meloidogyne enterolobii]